MTKRFVFFAIGVSVLLLAGCGRKATTGADGRRKVTLAFVNSTCYAPGFVAKNRGYFEEEGLDPEIIQADWAAIKEGLGVGRIDATQGLVMNYLVPISEGLDAKLTGGLHRGCLHLMVGKDTDIHSVTDLKGRRIGVPALGSSPWMFAVRAVGDAGLDYRNDVEWLPYPTAELELALEKGQVDGVAVGDPIAELLLRKGTVRSLVDQGRDLPYAEEYCCVVMVSGKLSREDPATAAAITRAYLKAAKWISRHPQETAQLLVDEKVVSGSVEVNGAVLERLNYVPSVSGGKLAARTAATSLKKIGVLNTELDVEELVDRITTAGLPGLDDAWIEAVDVEAK